MFSRLMGPRRPDILGIEIGTSAIKAVAVRPGASPTLLGVASAPVPAGTFEDGAVKEPARLAEAIKAAVATIGGLNPQKAQVVMGVPDQAAISRLIDMPHTPRKDLTEALPWEAERHLPFPIDEVNLDFTLQEDPANLPTDSRMEVVVVAARKESVAQLREVATLAGLRLAVMDIKPFAAVRAVFRSRADLRTPERGALIVEVGAGTTHISLLRGGRLLITRTIRMGADDFTVALQKEFNLSFDEAEYLKLHFHGGVSTWEGGASDWDAVEGDAPEPARVSVMLPESLSGIEPSRVHEVLRPSISDLTSEIWRSLEYYRAEAGAVALDSVVLCGGGARLVGLAESLTDSLGAPVSAADVLSIFGSDLTLPADLPDLTVPVGLALWGTPDA